MGGSSTKQISIGPESDPYKAAMAAFGAKQQVSFPKLAVISAQELISNDAYKNYTLVDVRSLEEISISRLPEASRLNEFLVSESTKKVVFYCALGSRAGIAAQEYVEKFPAQADNILVFAGSICGWTHFGGRLVDADGRDTKKVHAGSMANVKFFPDEQYDVVSDPPPHTNSHVSVKRNSSDSERYAEASQWFDVNILPRHPSLQLLEVEKLLTNESYKQYVMVDVRSIQERSVSTIPGSLSFAQFLENELPAKKIVFFCNSGGRASTAAQEYLEYNPLAAENVYNFKLSLVGWTHHKGPLVDAQGKPTKKVHSKKALFPQEFETVDVPDPETKPANFIGSHSSHQPVRKRQSCASQDSQKSSNIAKKRSWQVNQERYDEAKSWFDLNILPTQSSVTQLEAEELLRGNAYNEYTMVDCRSMEEINVSVIPSSILLDAFLAQSQQHKKIVFYCTVGGRSGKIAAQYTKHHPDTAGLVANFKLSLVAWCHNNGPLVDANGASTKKVHCWGKAQQDRFPTDYDVVYEPAPATNPTADFTGHTTTEDNAEAPAAYPEPVASQPSAAKDTAPAAKNNAEQVAAQPSVAKDNAEAAYPSDKEPASADQPHEIPPQDVDEGANEDDGKKGKKGKKGKGKGRGKKGKGKKW